MTSKTAADSWSIADANALYNFDKWGGGHFHVDAKGAVCVSPRADHRSIRLLDVIKEAAEMGLKPPFSIRFQDLIRHRVERLNEAFAAAIKSEAYEGSYRGVFPIKVNQLREVVEEIIDAGEPYHYGIEAGSKPELMIALALHRDASSLVICNGYKDDEYIRLALLGRKLGKQVIIVIEQHSEVEAIIRIAREEKVDPLLGIRVKLVTAGEGKWAESSGEEAKFGLTAPEIMSVAEQLKKEGLKNALRLVHFHIGSQVPNILTIKKAVVEAARFYCGLVKLGFPMGYLDVGGGLGVDYDGSCTAYESSMNYTVEQYARDVVANVQEVCKSAEVPVPHVVSESGRAIVAPHSVLVVEVFDRISKTMIPPDTRKSAKDAPVIKELKDILANRRKLNRQERFHDAGQKKEEAYSLFTLGYLDLAGRAQAEALYWRICQELRTPEPDEDFEPEELAVLDKLLAEQYVCNFSVFQSLIDHWACDQLFPVAPLHRLDKRPDVNATLVDITCDSEGKISNFIDLEEDSRPYLPLHPLDGKPYYIGVFLVGAYQDIMGDLHNLFGRVNELHVFLEDDEDDGFYVEETINGSNVTDLLSYIQFDERELSRQMKRQIDDATKADRVKPREGVRLQNFYEDLLKGKTYLKPRLASEVKKKRK